MLFLYRPPQTWMPYSLPQNRSHQAAYNRELQARYQSTLRRPPAPPAGADPTVGALSELASLHRSGSLSDDEFRAAKAKVLRP